MQLRNILVAAAYFAGQSRASALPPSHSNSLRGAAAGGDAGGAQAIIAGIGAVSDNLNGWAGAVSNYKIGYLSLVPLDKAEKATEASLDEATAAVKKSKPLTDKENSAVAGQVAAMLPKVKAVAMALKEKAPVMIKEKVGKEVAEDAAGVQNKMDLLFASLQVVMSAQTQPGLKKAMLGVDKVMSQTQATFSGDKVTMLTNEGLAASDVTGKLQQQGGAPSSDGVSWRRGSWGSTVVWAVVVFVASIAVA
ncbi:uncharacterized protein PG986_005673 [Apiospora aurea]|uniref:Uncharacterized protein n=1 Tax=Apiospora aurea TaxID=335848 RepID=A0ABR1QI84_9PEZI